MVSHSGPYGGDYSTLIRIGGAALLIAFAIHIVANVFLKEFPPSDPTLAELEAYLAAEAGMWKTVHGLRYIAIASLSLFLGGIVARTRMNPARPPGGWEYVGLVGGCLHLANLFITNGIETFAFLDFSRLSGQPDLFWLVFHMTRVLFTAETAAWAILIFGFSVAGWKSGTIPMSLAVLGFVAAAFAVGSGAFVGAVMTSGGWPGIASEIAAIASLAWFVSVGVLMLWRGGSSVRAAQPG